MPTLFSSKVRPLTTFLGWISNLFLFFSRLWSTLIQYKDWRGEYFTHSFTNGQVKTRAANVYLSSISTQHRIWERWKFFQWHYVWRVCCRWKVLYPNRFKSRSLSSTSRGRYCYISWGWALFQLILPLIPFSASHWDWWHLTGIELWDSPSK